MLCSSRLVFKFAYSDHEKENYMNISKMPDKLVYKWTRGVSDHRHKFGEFPTFKTFAIFLQLEHSHNYYC